MANIIPTAEPFFFPGDRALGCLLIHGFTGTPKEMRGLGERLAAGGYPVMGVRLAGHATQPDDMRSTSYKDWISSVEKAYHELHQSTQSICMIGLSMGGVLSLLLASRLPLKGVVAMSTPTRLPKDYPIWYIRLAAMFRPYMPKSKEAPGTGWFDREAWKDHVSYPRNPTRSVAELKLLLAEMRAALPQVRVPVLLMHSKDDNYVAPENMPLLHAALGTRDKSTLWIAGSGHVVTRDAAREQVYQATLDFLRRIEAAG